MVTSQNEWKLLKWEEKPQTNKIKGTKPLHANNYSQALKQANILDNYIRQYLFMFILKTFPTAEKQTSAEMVPLIASAFLRLGVLSLCLSHTAMAIGTVHHK